jgi:hypothetical protein
VTARKTTTITTMLDGALWALERGFKVFPCEERSKNPNFNLMPHGSKGATDDENLVRDWWTEWPNDNVGICGAIIVDADEGCATLAEAETWREKVGLPATLAVRTGRRTSYGIQYHYTGSAGSSPYDYEGVSGEVRTGNLYGMAPGSIHPDTGERYELAIDLPRAPYPTASAFERARIETKRRLDGEPSRLAAGEKIKRSFRQYWLVEQCGRLRRTGLSGAPLSAALRALCDQYCEAPEEKTDAMIRQIARSGEQNYGVHPPDIDSRPEVARMITELNEKFYIVEDFGGKCRVCSEPTSTLFPGTYDLTHQSFADFRNRFIHQKIQVAKSKDGGPVFQDCGHVWLRHEHRNQYASIVYAPEGVSDPSVRNLWRGFAFAPKAGDCSIYLEHLKENISENDEKKYDWLMSWLAYGIQHPGERGHTALVLAGGEGRGKNTAAEVYARLWGAHATTVSQKTHFTGHFNAHLRHCSVIVVNEALFAGDRSAAGVIKALITDPTINIESKGVDIVTTRNLLHVILCSNENWVIPADHDARRFTVFHVGDRRANDTTYFDKLHKQLDDGGYAALLHHLQNADISKFNPRHHLPTPELNDQKSRTLHGIDSVWFECLQRGTAPGKIDGVKGDDWMILRASDLVDWAHKRHQRGWNDLRTEHVGFLFRLNPRSVKKGMGFEKSKEGTANVFLIPPLAEARKCWDNNRFPFDWDDNDTGWQMEEEFFDRLIDAKDRKKDRDRTAK